MIYNFKIQNQYLRLLSGPVEYLRVYPGGAVLEGQLGGEEGGGHQEGPQGEHHALAGWLG